MIPATYKQLNYIKQLLDDLGTDFDTAIKMCSELDESTISGPNDLSIGEASTLIEELRYLKEQQ